MLAYDFFALGAAACWALGSVTSVTPSRHLGAFAFTRWRMAMVAVMLWTVREPSHGPRLVGWKVPKHRGGKKGRFGMWFNAPYYDWTEAEGELLTHSVPTNNSRGFE